MNKLLKYRLLFTHLTKCSTVNMSIIIGSVLVIVIAGCGGTSSNLLPRKSDSDKKAFGSEFADLHVRFLWEVKHEYASTPEAVDAAVIENIIQKNIENGYVEKEDFTRQNYLRRFYGNLLLKIKHGRTQKDLEKDARDYVENDAPIGLKHVVSLDPNRHYSPKTALTIRMPALKNGYWQIRPYSGGWSNWQSEGKPYTWVITISTNTEDDEGQNYGVTGSWWVANTEEEAFEKVKNIDPYKFVLDRPGDIRLWIPTEDKEGKTDNRGIIQVEISSVKDR
jgi:hypothetical protein